MTDRQTDGQNSHHNTTSALHAARKNLRFITVTLIVLKKQQKSMQKTSQFKTQCKGDISHASETVKITVFDLVTCKTPDAPLQLRRAAVLNNVVYADNWRE